MRLARRVYFRLWYKVKKRDKLEILWIYWCWIGTESNQTAHRGRRECKKWHMSLNPLTLVPSRVLEKGAKDFASSLTFQSSWIWNGQIEWTTDNTPATMGGPRQHWGIVQVLPSYPRWLRRKIGWWTLCPEAEGYWLGLTHVPGYREMPQNRNTAGERLSVAAWRRGYWS